LLLLLLLLIELLRRETDARDPGRRGGRLLLLLHRVLTIPQGLTNFPLLCSTSRMYQWCQVRFQGQSSRQSSEGVEPLS